METKSALSVFNDAMSLANQVGVIYPQKKQLETKAWVFMVHNLLKGEIFPVDDWFDSEAHYLFGVFFTYYSKHDCWESFRKNILNHSGKMYGLFVAAVYCQEQESEKHKKACVQSLFKNEAIDDEVLEILSDYAFQYPVLLDVLEELLKKQKVLREVDAQCFWNIYQEYHVDEYHIALKAMNILYLGLIRLQRPVDISTNYVNLLCRFRQAKLKLNTEEQSYHFEKLQKILQILSLKGAQLCICTVVLAVLNTPSFRFSDRLALVETYLDDFVDVARESNLIAGLSSRIFYEESSAKM